MQGANAVALETASAEQIWIRGLAQRMPFGKVLVAIANKHARQLWAMLARDEDYDAEAWLRHPMVQRRRSSTHTSWRPERGPAHEVQRQSEQVASGQTVPKRA